MTVAIMQPYLFPYLGYFQLIEAADRFVIYDDVAFTPRQWINRNRLLEPGKTEPFWLTVPTSGGRGPIRDVRLMWSDQQREKLLRRVERSYANAVYFHKAWPVISAALQSPETELGSFLRQSIDAVCDYLEIRTPRVTSSSEHADSQSLRGIDRVLEIARREGADAYLNSEGGRALYPPEPFGEAGIELQFIEHIERPYPQHRGGGDFVPRLSIIDAMMHNSPAALREMLLADYRITRP